MATHTYALPPFIDRHVNAPIILRGEDAPPAEGRVIWSRRWVELPPPARAVIGRREEPPPFDGLVTAFRGPQISMLRGSFLIARTEEPQPFAGSVFAGKPPVQPFAIQQLPGRVLIAWSEPPRPEEGRVWILTGRYAGAIPPSLLGAKPGGKFVRADAWNRAIRRLPRMAATLSYVTKTKTPDEVLAVVFDFTNFPELVGGATINSAVVSGPGGAMLAGLVAGTPQVLAAAAVVDSLGNTVAAGKGVQVALAGGAVGSDVIVECAATLSTGSIAVVQGKFAVRNAV